MKINLQIRISFKDQSIPECQFSKTQELAAASTCSYIVVTP